MQPLSPRYRNDNLDVLDDSTREYLDEHYLKHLENLDRSNPKLLVVFSAGNAVGKSTITRKINEQFQAIVLENDALKSHIKHLRPNIERDELNPLVWHYTMELYQRLGSLTNNGLVVRDGVIDWYYDRILPVFLDQGYEVFIIALDVSREKNIELIEKRGDTSTLTVERAKLLLEDHEIHQKRFRAAYTPDVTLTDDTLFDHDRILKALADRLAAMA